MSYVISRTTATSTCCFLLKVDQSPLSLVTGFLSGFYRVFDGKRETVGGVGSFGVFFCLEFAQSEETSLGNKLRSFFFCYSFSFSPFVSA